MKKNFLKAYSLILISLLYPFSAYSESRLSEPRVLNYEKNLDYSSFKKDPIEQFLILYRQMYKAKVLLPERAFLATVTKENRPTARMICIKKITSEGFIFHTDITSAKMKHIQHNRYVALVFFWQDLLEKKNYQIRVEGEAFPYKNPKHNILHVNKAKYTVKSQQIIIKPYSIEFSTLHKNKKIGLLEHILYVKENNQWKKMQLPDYMLPHHQTDISTAIAFKRPIYAQ